MVARQELGFTQGELERVRQAVIERCFKKDWPWYDMEYRLDDQTMFVVGIGASPHLRHPPELPQMYKPDHFGCSLYFVAPHLTGSASPAQWIDISATLRYSERRIEVWGGRAFYYFDPDRYIALMYEPYGSSGSVLKLDSATFREERGFGQSPKRILDLDLADEQVTRLEKEGYPHMADGLGTLLRYLFNTWTYGGKQRLTAAEIQRRPLIPAKL